MADFRKNETLAAELEAIADEYFRIADRLRAAAEALWSAQVVKNAETALAEAKRRLT